MFLGYVLCEVNWVSVLSDAWNPSPHPQTHGMIVCLLYMMVLLAKEEQLIGEEVIFCDGSYPSLKNNPLLERTRDVTKSHSLFLGDSSDGLDHLQEVPFHISQLPCTCSILCSPFTLRHYKMLHQDVTSRLSPSLYYSLGKLPEFTCFDLNVFPYQKLLKLQKIAICTWCESASGIPSFPPAVC